MNTTVPPLPGSKPSTGLATTSLVLGILSMTLCGFFTGVPAIITGHIAHGRAKRSPAQFGGGGLAIAGFVMGYVSVFVTLVILPALLLPALAKAKEKAERMKCVENLKQIGLGARLWAKDHNNQFPADFASFKANLVSPKILWCPRDKARTQTSNWNNLGPANITYEIVSPGAFTSDPAKVFARCPIHGHEALVDTSVQMKSSSPRVP